jgi:hypothetical protein
LEQLQIRCPRLGGEVTLAYCLREGGDLPCPRSVRCWNPYLPIEAFLRRRLTDEQWDRCFNRKPQEKIASLVGLAEAAKKGDANAS